MNNTAPVTGVDLLLIQAMEVFNSSQEYQI